MSHLGKLRWQVDLCNETIQQDPYSQGSLTTYPVGGTVWANIEPVKGADILNDIQEDYGAITHKITIRFIENVTDFKFIQRTRTLPDQTTRTELFRVHGITEIGGRLRFLDIEAELVTS